MTSQSLDVAVIKDAEARCQICGDGTLNELTAFADLPRVTSDCKPWPSGGRLAMCTSCGGIQKILDARWFAEIGEIYGAYEIYHLTNICASLAPHGAVIIGMPSLESQVYASAQSRSGHVNCKTQGELRTFLLSRFNQVFMFSMNDEVLHTGFAKMAHYHLALCCGKISV